MILNLTKFLSIAFFFALAIASRWVIGELVEKFDPYIIMVISSVWFASMTGIVTYGILEKKELEGADKYIVVGTNEATKKETILKEIGYL